MADITQTSFLGATLTSFSAAAGWNEQVSTLTVDLVEDPKARDRFFPPSVGEPVQFRSGAFAFDGLLQSQERTEEIGGRRIRVTVTDPGRSWRACPWS